MAIQHLFNGFRYRLIFVHLKPFNNICLGSIELDDNAYSEMFFQAYGIWVKQDFSILLALPRCSNGTCKENAICKDFNSTDLCDCKGGYQFNGKICVGKDIVFIIII